MLHVLRAAAHCRGVHRIAMIGSLATGKHIPDDADTLVTLAGLDDLAPLARDLLLSLLLELWLAIARRCEVPADVERLLLIPLEAPVTHGGT